MKNITQNPVIGRISAPEPTSNASNSSTQTVQKTAPNMTTTSSTTDAGDWRNTISTPEVTTTTSNTLSTTTTSTASSTNTLSAANSSRPARAPFSMAEMENEWSTLITLRNRSQSDNISALPKELKFNIFQQLPHTALFDRGLFSMACTSTIWQANVKAFLTPERIGIGFGGKLLHKEGTKLWQAEGKKLRELTPLLREGFKQSRKIIKQALGEKARVENISPAISKLAGIELDFKSIKQSELLIQVVTLCNEQIIKLRAGSIGRQRFLEEVLPALSNIPAGCRVVLDASKNDLHAQDLLPLIKLMKANPCIVQLDLSSNPLCSINEVSKPIVELFTTPSPLSHLYLKKTIFNDETAIEISKPLATNPCLRHLDLQFNFIGEKGALPLIDAVATISPTGKVHTNTVLSALRLQWNEYGDHSKNIFYFIDVAHRLLARAKSNFSENASEYPIIIQVDGVNKNIGNLRVLWGIYQAKFNKEAEEEKL